MCRNGRSGTMFIMFDFVLPCFEFMFSVLKTPFVFIYLGLAMFISCLKLIKCLVWGKSND